MLGSSLAALWSWVGFLLIGLDFPGVSGSDFDGITIPLFPEVSVGFNVG